MSQMIAVAAMVTVMLGALAAIGAAIRWLWRTLRSIARLADDFTGEPARGSMPARPGVLDRITAVEHRLEVLDRIEAALAGMRDLEARIAAIEARDRPREAALVDNTV